jgi:glycine betaine/choline ABC-type transport system substrate-binding protein
VNDSCGIVVTTKKSSEAKVVTGIAKAMISLAKMTATEAEHLSAGAIARANELSWVRLTEHVIGRAGRD